MEASDHSPFTGGGNRTYVEVPKNCDHNVGLMFEYRPGLYYEPFPRRLRLPKPTLPLEYVFIRILRG